MPPKMSIERVNELLDTRLAPLQEENDKLSKENAALRELNKQLLEKLDLLISKFDDIQPSNPPAHSQSDDAVADLSPADLSPATPSCAVIPPETFATKSHTLVLSDSIYRHVLSSCPKRPFNLSVEPL